VAAPLGILNLDPQLSNEPLLKGHKPALESFGKKLDDKQKSLRALEILFAARTATWDAVRELSDEIAANNKALVVLTEGLAENVLRAALSLFEGATLDRPHFNTRVVSSSLGTEALGRLCEDMVGQPVCLCVVFHSDPSPRLLWCYRLLYSCLAQGRPAEELRRRVILAAGEPASNWGEWARKSGFRTLTFPDRCAGRYLFFSEPLALILQLAGVPAWQCVEGGRSFVRGFEKQAGLADPILAYAALREVQLSDFSRETLMVPDETFRDFARWWRLLGEDSRQEFAEDRGESQILLGAVMLERAPEKGRQWVTEVRVEGDRELQVEALDESTLDPWPEASKRHWAPLEPHYEMALDHQRADAAHARPCVRLRLRRCDPLSVGALFAFFEAAVSAGHRLADLDDGFDLLRARGLQNFAEAPV
jgi:hypothetical protein